MASLGERSLLDNDAAVRTDHGFDRFPFTGNGPAPERVFAKRRAGQTLTEDERVAYTSALAVRLGRQSAARGRAR